MHDRIAALLREDRLFEPAESFVARARVKDRSMHVQAQEQRLDFWAAQADKFVEWFRRWDTLLEWDPPFARWFRGGILNVSYNCLDRHLRTWRRHKAAIVWEGERGEDRVLTYQDLHREVCRFANALKALGMKRGDRVAIYMGMTPELPVAMLACARIGAIHSVIFGGFSSEALRDRVNDCQASAVITADGAWRRGKVVPLKRNVDEALGQTPSVHKVVVVRRIGHESLVADWQEGRDFWWHELVAGAGSECTPEPMDAEEPLFILYTSGSTGKPKGVLHTSGGYLTQVAYTTQYVFDIQDDDFYWCTADIGWVTGHSYIVYGPLSIGATSLMYEGTPDYPDRGRFWAICQKHRVNVFYTAPTAIRSFMKWGTEWPGNYDLSSLRLLGTVGEPINPEAWMWYHMNIGKERCPIVDTWWQTETGAILISPLPGITRTKPGSATEPLPGIVADIVDAAGNPVGPNEGGFLVIREPWPSMLRTVWGDPGRYVENYFSKFGREVYFTGDGAKRDENGYFIIVGRVDDVLNVAGHRIGTWEVESALVDHPGVAEAAVIGRTDEVKGQAIAAFVVLKEGVRVSDELPEELRQQVARKIGAIARPEDIVFTADLPKTRSGKIMRRLLRDIAEGRTLGDTTTLAEPAVVARLREMYEEVE
jgi:acetyl-CoA synthetase